MTDFSYTDLLPRESGGSETPYRLVTTEGINVVDAGGRSFLSIEPEVLRLLTYEAFHDISHLLRPITWHNWPPSSMTPKPAPTIASSLSIC